MGAGASTLPDDVAAAVREATEEDLIKAAEDQELMAKLSDDDRAQVLGALPAKSATVFKIQTKVGFVEVDDLAAYFASLSAGGA